MIRPSKTHVGRPVSTRGPSSVAPAILKVFARNDSQNAFITVAY